MTDVLCTGYLVNVSVSGMTAQLVAGCRQIIQGVFAILLRDATGGEGALTCDWTGELERVGCVQLMCK
jgi:hypothetical protein